MNPRLFLNIDPRKLRLPNSRRLGADPHKLQRQIIQFGSSTVGMPAIEVSRRIDGEFVINNGVTRATRVAKLLPNALVLIEVIDDIPVRVGKFPTIEDTLP